MMSYFFRHTVESTVFAAGAMLLVLCLRKQSAAARHAVWLVAAAKFAIPLQLCIMAGAYARTLLPALQPRFAASFALPTEFAPALAATAAADARLDEAWLGLWLGGAMILLAIWLSKLFARPDCVGVVQEGEIEARARLKQRLKMRTHVKLRTARSGVEPGVSGIIRPTIFIPERLSGRLMPKEFEAVLVHELAHVRRWDNLTAALVHVLRCVFWFHPLLWWIERRASEECERACDELVVASGATPDEYVAGILKVCYFHVADEVAGYKSVAGSNLKRRVELIMTYGAKRGSFHSVLFAAATILIGMAVAPFAGGFLASAAERGQTTRRSSGSAASAVTCVYDGKEYVEGTVVQAGQTSRTMCVRDSGGNPMWVRMTPAMLERGRTVVKLAAVEPPLPAICEPRKSPSPKFCACQNGLYSLGAGVFSANGRLVCTAGKWEPGAAAEISAH